MEYFHFIGRLYYELVGKEIRTEGFRVQLGIAHSPFTKNLGKLAIIEDDGGGRTISTISNDAEDVAEFVHTQEYTSIVNHHKFVKGCANADGTLASLWSSA